VNPQPRPGADAGAAPNPAAPATEPAARPSWAARWHGYRRAALGDDLVAALIVTILLVPQSLAYALLAGLPPVVGVMASLLPIVAYAAFGSSTTLAVGPVAVLSMMTAQAIVPAAQANGVGVHLAAMVLAVEIAGVFVLALLLRLDVFAALLSAPVLHGFVTGASLVIAIGQLPSLLGVAARGSTLTELLESLAQVPSVWPHAATAAIGLGALALLWLIRRHGLAALRALGLPARARGWRGCGRRCSWAWRSCCWAICWARCRRRCWRPRSSSPCCPWWTWSLLRRPGAGRAWSSG
jgi:SulP family sulfate permease